MCLLGALLGNVLPIAQMHLLSLSSLNVKRKERSSLGVFGKARLRVFAYLPDDGSIRV